MKTRGYSGMRDLKSLTKAEIKERNYELYGSKIKKFRTAAGMSVDRLAGILDISVSSIRNWECGLTRPDPEYLYMLFTILDIEPNTFFGIKGVGTELSKQEQNLLSDFRVLSDDQKEDIAASVRTIRETTERRLLRKARKAMVVVPFFERFAAAGKGEEWQDNPEKKDYILVNNELTSRADEIIMVSGDSMEPEFYNHDRVLVEYCSEISNGEIGIFYADGYGGLIKQKAPDRLHSLNPEYDDVIPYESGARLIGRVIGKITSDMVPAAEDSVLYQEAVAMGVE